MMKWNNPIMINGTVYESSDKAHEVLKDFKGKIEIKLNFKGSLTPKKTIDEAPTTDSTVFKIQVKKYMTEKATQTFDFMKKWNDDKPMPFVVMYGTILQETKGMLKMKLHARVESNSTNCMHCGRELTNEISKMYGIGPICGGHMHIAPPKDVDEYLKNEAKIRSAIESVQWEGWIIKSAIKEKTIAREDKVEANKNHQAS